MIKSTFILSYVTITIMRYSNFINTESYVEEYIWWW